MRSLFSVRGVATGLRACGRPLSSDRHGGLSLLFLLLALSPLLPAPCSIAATVPADLGQGLAYLQVTSLTDPLPASSTALILDLRYVATDKKSAEQLKTFLGQQPVGPAWFVLVSPSTPATLAPILNASRALTLGAPESVPTPKVIVHTDSAADRQAYDALAVGTPLEKLITGKIEKERYDEATLVKEFNEGIPEPLPPPAPDPTALPGNPAKPGVSGTNTGPAAAGNGAPLTDRVLQRAIHLHRALLAWQPRS